MSCPLCAGSTRLLFLKDGYRIDRCDDCAHQAVIVADSPKRIEEVYGDHYFEGGQAGYPGYLEDGPLLRAHGRRYARLLRRYTEPGRVLDIGTAAGFILQAFVEAGWSGKGIEPNATMARYARSVLGLDVENRSLEQVTPRETFDLVSMIQVVSHFVEPRRALENARDLTRPGGYWLIETWNRSSWTARLFGRNWHEYSPPSVLHWFSTEGLGRLLGELGFREVARGRPLKWLSAIHAKALLSYKLDGMRLGRPLQALVRRIPDGLRVPYLGGDLFWALYRKT